MKFNDANALRSSLSDVAILESETFLGNNSRLLTYESIFSTAINMRFFLIEANAKTIRGNHAHKKANQWFICLRGQVSVSVNDGKDERKFELLNSEKVLYLPAGLWATQFYERNSSLLVITDKHYDKSDYVDDFEIYTKLKIIK